jgi:lipoyl(octanoyl) transferase
MAWRLIRSGPLDGAMNMALDQTLFEAVSQGRSGPVLRLYRWRRPTVSLGYFQDGRRTLNLAACAADGLDIVRRITGGRTVLHHQEITYAVIAPEGHPLFSGGILDDYRIIASVLQETIVSFGIPATLQPRPTKKTSNTGHQACFFAPSSYELICSGVKMAGSAQKRDGRAFLQHGSLPIEMDLKLLARIFSASSQSGGDLAGHVGWLNRWLEEPVALDCLETRLAEIFARQWSIIPQVGEPTAEEWHRAAELVAERYDNEQWTLPDMTIRRGRLSDQGEEI